MQDVEILEKEFSKIEEEILKENLSEEKILQRREERKKKFPPLTMADLLDVLGLTIKEDNVNKVITFLCCLSAYTETSAFNLSYNAPSSSGKSYIPLEISSLFPAEDVQKVGYCSPTAYFHDKGNFDKATGGYQVDLSHKILIFVDMPHAQLLQHLRPILSHDEKELHLKITDRNQKFGLRTKQVTVIGYPSVIFCTAGLKIDEQEATRFLLLSPDTTQEKIREGLIEALRKVTDEEAYLNMLNSNPKRQMLIERIKAIKEEKIKKINLNNPDKIKDWFLSRQEMLKPRHQRDIKRLTNLIQAFSLVNLWHKPQAGIDGITTTDEDIEVIFSIWEHISDSQELNIPPYILKLFRELFLPLSETFPHKLRRQEILQGHFRIYKRPLPEWKLRKEILPMLEMAGLIVDEPDPDDRRGRIITVMQPGGEEGYTESWATRSAGEYIDLDLLSQIASFPKGGK